jgi:hypothetical protein
MNNDAFKALVRDRAKVKSTKQIAREAVEDEDIRRTKKRKKGGGGGGDSSEEEDDDDDRRGPPKKEDFRHSQMLLPRSVAQEDDEESSKYRDRAKERREGKKERREGKIDAAADAAADAEETKDDEIPLQKGLDLNLARKIKKGLRKNGDSESSSAKPDGVVAAVVKSLPTMEQAKDVLRNFVEGKSSTVKIGSALSDYLHRLADESSSNNKTVIIKCGVAGRTILRSRLALSLDGHPSDYIRAWEIPREITHPNPKYDQYNKPRLGMELIAQIDGVLQPKGRSWRKEESNDSKVLEMALPVSKSAADEGLKDDGGDDDSDGDIFGGLDDYVPTAPKKATET